MKRNTQIVSGNQLRKRHMDRAGLKAKEVREMLRKPIDPAKPLDKFRFKIVSEWGKKTLLASLARLGG